MERFTFQGYPTSIAKHKRPCTSYSKHLTKVGRKREKKDKMAVKQYVAKYLLQYEYNKLCKKNV